MQAGQATPACLREYGKSPSLPQAAVDAHALLVTTTTAMQLCEHGGSTDRRCTFGWTVPTPSIIAIRGQHGGSGELSRRSDCHWLRGRSSARQCAVAVPHHARQFGPCPGSQNTTVSAECLWREHDWWRQQLCSAHAHQSHCLHARHRRGNELRGGSGRVKSTSSVTVICTGLCTANARKEKEKEKKISRSGRAAPGGLRVKSVHGDT